VVASLARLIRMASLPTQKTLSAMPANIIPPIISAARVAGVMENSGRLEE
jgi:hypothetical protein